MGNTKQKHIYNYIILTLAIAIISQASAMKKVDTKNQPSLQVNIHLQSNVPYISNKINIIDNNHNYNQIPIKLIPCYDYILNNGSKFLEQEKIENLKDSYKDEYENNIMDDQINASTSIEIKKNALKYNLKNNIKASVPSIFYIIGNKKNLLNKYIQLGSLVAINELNTAKSINSCISHIGSTPKDNILSIRNSYNKIPQKLELLIKDFMDKYPPCFLLNTEKITLLNNIIKDELGIKIKEHSTTTDQPIDDIDLLFNSSNKMQYPACDDLSIQDDFYNTEIK